MSLHGRAAKPGCASEKLCPVSGASRRVLTGPVSLLSPPGRSLRAIEGRSLVPHQLPLPSSAYPSYLQSKPWGMGVGVIQRL